MHEDCGEKLTCPCYKRRMSGEAAWHFQIARSLQQQSGGYRAPKEKKTPINIHYIDPDAVQWLQDEGHFKRSDIVDALKDEKGDTEELIRIGLNKLGKVKA